MPTYYYKAVTKNGVIVRNKVEDINRLNLMKKLRNNDLIPLTVIQTTKKKMNKVKSKRNTQGMSDTIKATSNDEYNINGIGFINLIKSENK